MIGAAVSTPILAAILGLGMSGGGGGGAGGQGHGHRSGPGSGAAAGANHLSASRGLAGVPATERYSTGPGAACELAPRSRYLPRWSGCVSTMLVDLFGDGRRDLVLTYSLLGHTSLRGLPPRTIGRRTDRPRYPALQAMLRVVTPAGRITTVPISYETSATRKAPAQLQRAAAAALISVARVSPGSAKTIFVQTGQISSGSAALVYRVNHGRLVSSGVALAYGGDAGSQAGFQCLAGDPPELIQRTYSLVRGIRAVADTVHIYGVWTVTTTRFGWHGPQLVRLDQSTSRRRLIPIDSVGRGCLGAVAKAR